ncbi:MAG: hypothetical protein IIZ93_15275 [Acidaminococcaceae bacterium]|nr:hypothetical protein [Acidaminococcaceae bacterium]
MELAIAFVVGCLVLMALAENPKLEDLTDKELVNRMADRSRKGWGKPKRMKYTKAGLMK